MPVENRKGELVGLVTSRTLLKYFTHTHKLEKRDLETVDDIMIKNPITVAPNASLMHAMNIMREHKIGCLPVVQEKELIGIITEMDFLRISSRLMDRLDAASK